MATERPDPNDFPLVDDTGGTSGVIGGFAAPRQGNSDSPSSRRFNQGQYGFRAQYRERAPIYMDGDEFSLLNSMTPAEVARIQTQMAAAGLIGPNTTYIPGNASTTRSEFRALLAEANGMGVSWRDALRTLAAAGVDGAGEGGTDTGSGATLPTYQSPNRDDVRAAIRRGMFTQFGTHAHGVDLDALTDQYLAMNRSNFDANVALGSAGGGGGEVSDVQSLEGFVEDQATEADPMGVQSRDFLDRADQFFAMLGGPT